ncbi:hypothetical protein PENTCL1PPCAC_5550 [Pristionchus entomophagus]|uniref:non-specific serine/threonine protein kinase n=1 Tax=Pristionchus entomophagus TaxID=358040 RepID=A0AAV5SKB7_9BILA|nr:hypothetical protein PENTCL1PPCAC_5550 [Pristionchus entomophagus]
MSSSDYYLDGPPGTGKESPERREATPQPHSLETTPRAARVGGGGGGRRSNRFPLERQYAASSGMSTPERRSSETGEELAAILGRRSRTSTASSISSTTLAAETTTTARYGSSSASGCTSCGLSAASAAAAASLPPPIPIPMRRDREEQYSPISSSPASSGLPPPLPTTPTSRHSANSSPHLEHSPHSGQLQRANRPSPILVKDKELQQLQQSGGSYGSRLSGECICVPPVLLSPVLSRPVRSASAASSPLPGRSNQQMGSDSDGDLNIVWRLPQNRRSMDRPGSRTNTPTLSPILNRSSSASKLAASFAANRSSSGSGLLSTRVLLRRTDSDAADARRRRKGKRRPSFMSHGMCSETSMDSCSSSTTNLTKMRLSLGHSDPQISASSLHAAAAASAAAPSTSSSGAAAGGSSAATTALPAVRMRKDVLSHSARGPHSARHSTARRSLNTSTSPVLAPRARSPHRQLLPSAAGSSSGSYHGSSAAGISVAGTSQPSQPSTSSTNRGVIAPVPLRSYSTRSGSSLMAPGHHHHHDNRRWSLASLPSTSGYGTPGSNSAFSSQYSSNEQLCEALDGIRLHHSHHHGHHQHAGHSSQRFDSNDSSVTNEEVAAVQRCESGGGAMTPHQPFRPRSRSLTSPVKLGGSEWTTDVVVRNSVYKERFPRAKQQMEEKLETFVRQNAPLSGGPSSAETDDVTSGGGGISSRNRKSMVLTAETTLEPALLRLIADGATRFLHHQLVEIASDCLLRSRDDTITCSYFCEMSQRLDETLNEATQKTSGDSFDYLNKLVRQLLMIVSRPARLLECLEFDPDEFYHLLEEAEGVVREQLGSGTARVPDLPQYIIGKLGLDRDPLLEAEQAGACSPPSTPAVEAPDQKQDEAHRAPCEDDLETIRLVSNGAYGAVYLVRHRETRQRFALKKMNKQTLMLRNQIDQVFAERDILTMTDNPFVVSFYGSFETRHHLCMLMEYVEGGDCASLLKNAGTLPIDLMKLYVAETILAIEYLHSYGVVHRDLKPDNLLITAMGHIKLTDFGLSKIGLMNRTTLVAEGVADIAETQQFKDKQLCGTPEYIAPEVIIRQGYGKPVDWWALGIISYEFLVGIVPFFGESPEDLFSKVISEDVEYPDGEEALPPSAESLIKQLLEKNPIERLGSVTGAPELMAHEFFADLDFNGLLRQKAEFVPQLENDEDTSYFDSRTDRYNHDAAESNGEEEGGNGSAPMFHSFSTASPRHSIVGLEPGPLLPPERIAACTSPLSHEMDSPSPTPSLASSRPTPSPSAMSRKPAPPSAQSSEEHSTTDSLNDVHDKYGQPMASAVLLRRRFSAQRQSNLSTSSSGTTGTNYVGTAPSSTDSSMDAFAFGDRRMTHGEEGRLRTDSTSTAASSISRRSPLPRFAISCDPDEDVNSPLPCSSGSFSSSSAAVAAANQQPHHELSPVDEGAARERSSVDRLPGSLQLVIPSGASSSGASSKISPGAASACSLSSYDGCSSLEHGQSTQGGAPVSPLSMAPPIVIRKGPFGFGFTIKSVRVYLGEYSDYYTIEHIVSSVDERGPAFEAGLRCEDMITSVNAQPVHNMTHPQLMNLMLSSGCEIVLKVTPLAATGIREGGPRKNVGKLARKQKQPKCPKRRLPCEKKSRKPSSLLRRLSGKRNANDIVPGSSSQKQTFMPRSVSSQDGVILQPAPTSAPPTGVAPLIAYGAQPSSGGPSTTTTISGGSHSSGSMTSMGIPTHKRMSDVGLMRDEHRSPLVSASSTSAFSPAHPSPTPSPRPSSLSGLKPTGSAISHSPSPRSISAAPAAVSAAAGLPCCPTLSMGGGGVSIPLSTSPIPVSPLARQPSNSVSRPTSPRPDVTVSAAPTAPAASFSSTSDRPAPPPIPPPPAARNLMQRLLNKD